MPARKPQRAPWFQGAAGPAGRWLVPAAIVVALASGAGGLRGAEGLTREARITLIRGFVSEIAVVKIALPRSKQGVVLTPAGIDKEKVEAALRTDGVAIKPGLPAEITKIRFKPQEIIFELNGGPRRGKKWYQRIEISGGISARRIDPGTNVASYGSVIHLRFEKKVPNVSVAEVKQMLSAVLDFERRAPTVLYSPAVPPKFKEAIKKHEVLVGMDRDAVLSSRGQPERKVRETRDGVDYEDWIYGLPPHVLMVTFEGDHVVAVRQH
jgi:hypothetical protein